jgi:hypothetical protein
MLKNKLNWIDFKFEIKNSNFTTNLLQNKLNIFWREVMETKLNDNQHIWLLFRLQWTNNQFVTIGKLVKLNKEDKDYLFDFILNNLEDKSDYYKEYLLKSMIFSYTIKKGKAKEKVTFDNLDLRYQYYFHHKLPITMDPLKYGKLIDKIGNKFYVQVNKTNIAIIIQEDNKNLIKLYREGEIAYEYTDIKINDSTFVRHLENKKLTFKNNELILLTIDKSTKFIDPLLPLQNLTNKFITLDIETFIKDGIHIPYCISWYESENTKNYYLTDFKDPDSMITQAIKDLMIKKYDNYKIYVHNLARFDAIFLLKILINLGKVKPIIHNRELISIDFKLNDYIIAFRGSLQLLIYPLRDLAKSFGVNTQKSIFPYTFVNENNLDYIGEVPEFKYFDGITINEYNNYKNKFDGNLWNLKNETVKYCVIDCISLHEIILKFSNMIFELFKISIHKYPTLSAIAFAIFRTHFLKKDEIPQLSGQIDKDIRAGYTGGAVDMYIPENPEGTKMHVYDVNSLYPFTMDEFDMPIGKPILFYGDIRKVDPNAFGFFYCKIIAPDNLEHPILQTHVKINKGTRTIAPLGTWSDMLFSVEMDNAMKIGYQFEILWGYTFERKNIFKNYVDILYELRGKFPKTDPMNLIAKLLLNSLYGRFGMKDSFLNITIFNDFKLFKKWFDIHNEDVNDFMELGEKVLVQHRSELLDQKTELYGTLETHNTSITIASCITAYARIHMSQFKNNPDFNLYYSDTDSAYIDRPLPKHLVNNKILGKMKLENICKKAIFLAPKVYYLETVDGKIIYKVKGLKHEVELTKNDFENLLFKESFLEKIQTKWIKNFSDAHIEVRNEMYTLQVTDNKRKLIYDNNNKLIGTTPYIINDNKEIINK